MELTDIFDGCRNGIYYIIICNNFMSNPKKECRWALVYLSYLMQTCKNMCGNYVENRFSAIQAATSTLETNSKINSTEDNNNKNNNNEKLNIADPLLCFSFQA